MALETPHLYIYIYNVRVTLTFFEIKRKLFCEPPRSHSFHFHRSAQTNSMHPLKFLKLPVSSGLRSM